MANGVMPDFHLVDKYLKNPRFTKSTRVQYKSTLYSFGEFCNKPWHKISVEDLDEFLNTKPSLVTRQSLLWRIKPFLRWIHNDDLPKTIDAVCQRRRSMLLSVTSDGLLCFIFPLI
ncbi:MAG: hypothetical protein Q6364_09690 [Candidatus Hermodarchaeota archaeon]|nr:hypothetical protein [Candidatus Hermodarchaeota archaeon]